MGAGAIRLSVSLGPAFTSPLSFPPFPHPLSYNRSHTPHLTDRLYNDPARTWPPIVSVIVLPVPQAWEGKDAKCRARHSRVKSPPAAAVGECGMDIGGGAVGGMSGVGGMNGVGMGSGRGLLVDGNGTVGNGTVGEVVSGGGNGVGGARNRTVEGAWRGEVRNMTSALGEGGGGK